MLEQFLHEQLEIAFEWGVPKPEIPGSITQNLNPTFELRPYQEDAFASFVHYFNTDLPGKEKPVHLLFNMATGSGKTLIMAGLILYLYEIGSNVLVNEFIPFATSLILKMLILTIPSDCHRSLPRFHPSNPSFDKIFTPVLKLRKINLTFFRLNVI